MGDPDRDPGSRPAPLRQLLDDPLALPRWVAMTTWYAADRHHVYIGTHGVGTGSTEIIIDETIALKFIDVETHTSKAPPAGFVNIIRVGTSCSIHSKVDLDVRHPPVLHWHRQHGPLLRCTCG